LSLRVEVRELLVPMATAVHWSSHVFCPYSLPSANTPCPKPQFHFLVFLLLDHGPSGSWSGAVTQM
jgi:hypothetical protein